LKAPKACTCTKFYCSQNPLRTALCFVERLCSTSTHSLFLSHIIICNTF